MQTTPEAAPRGTPLSLLLPCLLLGLVASCQTDGPTDSVLQRLQGTWEGFGLGRETPTGPYVKSDPAEKITITITGDSLHFHRDEDFWWDTTFTLPECTGPRQLHATIKRPEESAGDVVIALLEFEGETLTLGGIRSEDSTEPWPARFEDAKDTMTGRYELRKVSR